MTKGRLSKEDKGKSLVLDPFQAPRTARVKVQVPDNSRKLHQHSLTLIGRVTNQSVQKVWSVIPFFTELWKTEHSPVGSDLGNGMFQFQFAYEADLLAVLEKRPFHYAKWMVIVQRWEPTVSEAFPSLIPFWIKIQGVPIHLWSEETARSLGEDIGIYEKAEVTPLAMKMRVHINGRLPLIKTSVIEYSKGDEVTAIFVYEKLERHCSKCFRLDHDIKDCLVAKHHERALKVHEDTDNIMKLISQRNGGREKTSPDAGIFRFSATEDRVYERNKSQRYMSYDPHYDARHTIDSQRRYRSLIEANRQHRSREPSREWQRNHYSGSSQNRRESPYHRRVGEARYPLRNDNHNHNSMEYDSALSGARGRDMMRREESRSSRGGKSLSIRGNPLPDAKSPAPQEAFNEALEEVREVMVQYTQCVDPSESAARRERLRKAEEEGQLEETAARMVQASLGDKADVHHDPRETEETPSAERIPIALRLGPMAPQTSTPDQNTLAVEKEQLQIALNYSEELALENEKSQRLILHKLGK
ncbi:BnaC01g39380D [Brassica napus]|uniref:BnaC01g39380D protein n=1 Tax=Brassica napus TaxID=3708 RepID=A0A078GBU5_BRANA|nr:BnaC01g39380D [Brassica napus]